MDEVINPDAFIERLEKLVSELEAELEPYRVGISQARKCVDGAWVHITPIRITQIAKEIRTLLRARAQYHVVH